MVEHFQILILNYMGYQSLEITLESYEALKLLQNIKYLF